MSGFTGINSKTIIFFFKVVMNLCQKTYLLTNNLTICLIIMEINICEVRFALVCYIVYLFYCYFV